MNIPYHGFTLRRFGSTWRASKIEDGEERFYASATATRWYSGPELLIAWLRQGGWVK